MNYPLCNQEMLLSHYRDTEKKEPVHICQTKNCFLAREGTFLSQEDYNHLMNQVKEIQTLATGDLLKVDA